MQEDCWRVVIYYYGTLVACLLYQPWLQLRIRTIAIRLIDMDLGAAFPLLMVNSVVIGYVLQEGSS